MAVELGFGALQAYTTGRPLELPTRADRLAAELRGVLVRASNERKLSTPPKQATDYVKLMKELPSDIEQDLREKNLPHKDAFCIVGGKKNQGRDPALPHFKRNDGAWFDFSIVGRKLGEGIELLAYNFEIRCAPRMGAPFLRFDLNPPDHRNEARALRCHLHPGSDDILIPAPLLTPAEMLTLFIDGIRFPTDRGRRAPTAFEVGWLTDTLAQAKSMT